MPNNSLLLVIGETSQYSEAEKVRDVMESKLDVKFKVEELEDIGPNVTAAKFKSVTSKVQAVLLLCSDGFQNRIDRQEQISFNADGTRGVTLDKNAIPEALDDPKINNKFILLSFGSPAAIPMKLRDKSQDDIFTFKKNIQGKELVDALKPVAIRIKSK